MKAGSVMKMKRKTASSRENVLWCLAQIKLLLSTENVVNLIAQILLHLSSRISSIVKRTQRECFVDSYERIMKVLRNVNSFSSINYGTNHKFEETVTIFEEVKLQRKPCQSSIITYLYKRKICLDKKQKLQWTFTKLPVIALTLPVIAAGNQQAAVFINYFHEHVRNVQLRSYSTSTFMPLTNFQTGKRMMNPSNQ